MGKINAMACFLLIILLQACAAQKSTPPPASTYKPASEELYREIYLMDSLMFSAFNQQDTEKLMSFFSEDLEFYHDQGGLDDYEKTRQKTVQLFNNNQQSGLTRTLVPGSLEVYPIPGHGAVSYSLHRFCHEEQGKQDCGTFKNIMIWKKISDQWRVSRVISYDH